MRVHLGSDHAGLELKEHLLNWLADHGFEVVTLANDRVNYGLWCRKVHERWVARHKEVLEVVDEATWRLHRLVQSGGVYCMGPHATDDTAYRVVLARRNHTLG